MNPELPYRLAAGIGPMHAGAGVHVVSLLVQARRDVVGQNGRHHESNARESESGCPRRGFSSRLTRRGIRSHGGSGARQQTAGSRPGQKEGRRCDTRDADHPVEHPALDRAPWIHGLARRNHDHALLEELAKDPQRIERRHAADVE